MKNLSFLDIGNIMALDMLPSMFIFLGIRPVSSGAGKGTVVSA